MHCLDAICNSCKFVEDVVVMGKVIVRLVAGDGGMRRHQAGPKRTSKSLSLTRDRLGRVLSLVMAGSKYAYVRNFELPDPLLPGTFLVYRLDGHSFHR